MTNDEEQEIRGLVERGAEVNTGDLRYVLAALDEARSQVAAAKEALGIDQRDDLSHRIGIAKEHAECRKRERDEAWAALDAAKTEATDLRAQVEALTREQATWHTVLDSVAKARDALVTALDEARSQAEALTRERDEARALVLREVEADLRSVAARAKGRAVPPPDWETLLWAADRIRDSAAINTAR